MMRSKFSTVLAGVVLAPSIVLAAEAWRLPIPVRVADTARADVSGVLVPMGDAIYQASDFGLQRTADGRIAVAWLQGYDADGVSVRIERSLEGATMLGVTKSVAVGTDAGGFLLVGQSASALGPPTYPCGITRMSTCYARNCKHCGDAPLCACQDASGGGCDPAQREYCDGSCGFGICNQSTTACACMGTAPGPSRTDPKPPGKAPQLVPYVTPE